MTGPVRIAVVMACFNRRATSLRCLEALYAQQGDLALDVHLLDDASPDGTGEAIRAAFPQVHLIQGDGQRFWGGGMHLAMQSAQKTDYDFMLWLNDDVELASDALARLLSAAAEAEATGPGPHVVIGAVADPDTGTITYAGFNRRNRWHPAQLAPVRPAPHGLTPCDTMNGNCVLVPAAMVRRIGLIDPTFIQQLGDIDYGYRVRRAGGRLWIAPGAVGTCAANVRPRRWQDPSLNLFERLKILNSPHGLPLKPWLTFLSRHGGVIGMALLAVSYGKALSWKGPHEKPEPRSA